MGSPEADTIRVNAQGRITDRPNLVLDGNPIEELAKAHDRHAARLDAVARGLRDVGQVNYLGNTSEGHAATNNIRVAAHQDPRSAAATAHDQAATARSIARALREVKWAIDNAEAANTTSIKSQLP